MITDDHHVQLRKLKQEVRRLRVLVGICLCGLGFLALSAWRGQAVQGVVRTKALIVVDSQGRERIVVGAPVPEPEGKRIAPVTGLVIKDENGAERLGAGLLANGRVVVGLDAPPGTGKGGNRERITLSAGANGGAEMRFLNQQSLVAAHMSLFGDGNVSLFFTSRGENGTKVHAISADGDTVVLHPPR